MRHISVSHFCLRFPEGPSVRGSGAPTKAWKAKVHPGAQVRPIRANRRHEWVWGEYQETIKMIMKIQVCWSARYRL